MIADLYRASPDILRDDAARAKKVVDRQAFIGEMSHADWLLMTTAIDMIVSAFTTKSEGTS